VWYPRALLETDRNGGTQVAFAGNTIANVVGQCGNYTDYGVKSLHGRGWNLVNVSPWDIAKNPSAVSLEVMADARPVNIFGGLLTTQNVTIAAPAGHVLIQDQSMIPPWSAQPVAIAAAAMQPDQTVANVPTQARRGQAVGWVLTDSPAIGVVMSVSVPNRASVLSFSFQVAGISGATGDVVMTAAFTRIEAGSTLTGGVTSKQVTVTVGADDVVASGTTADSSVTPGRLYSVRLYRSGGNANDTYAGSVILVGAAAKFTS